MFTDNQNSSYTNASSVGVDKMQIVSQVHPETTSNLTVQISPSTATPDIMPANTAPDSPFGAPRMALPDSMADADATGQNLRDSINVPVGLPVSPLNGPKGGRKFSTDSQAPPGNEKCNLYAASLPADFDDAAMRELFGAYGEISSAKAMCDPASGKCKGYGFVMYEKEEDAARAIKALNGSRLSDGRIQVRHARPRPQNSPQQQSAPSPVSQQATPSLGQSMNSPVPVIIGQRQTGVQQHHHTGQHRQPPLILPLQQQTSTIAPPGAHNPVGNHSSPFVVSQQMRQVQGLNATPQLVVMLPHSVPSHPQQAGFPNGQHHQM